LELKRKQLVFIILLLLGAAVLALLVSPPPPLPSAAVRFIELTNAPSEGRLALFEITNTSNYTIRRDMCHVGGELVQIDPVELGPGEVETVRVRLGSSFKLPLTVRFQFRRPDTKLEDLREGLDSLLRTIPIRVPGLNPDSPATEFEASAEIPE
jgi:hypothetical protein